VPRAIFTDVNFASEPLTEVQAFLNLVADAGWQPRRVRLARGAVDLERGQLLASTGFLAERWQWPEPRVRRFINYRLLRLHGGGGAVFACENLLTRNGRLPTLGNLSRSKGIRCLI
jgi:hypothetical protein